MPSARCDFIKKYSASLRYTRRTALFRRRRPARGMRSFLRSERLRLAVPEGVAHFGFRLVDAEDIDSALRAVKSAGGEVLSHGEFCPGEPYLFCRDPDGYEVEIWYELRTPVDPRRPNQSVERTATRLVATRRVARVLPMSSTCALVAVAPLVLVRRMDCFLNIRCRKLLEIGTTSRKRSPTMTRTQSMDSCPTTGLSLIPMAALLTRRVFSQSSILVLSDLLMESAVT